ncbi:MAG TPA: ABC transporter substrate-binding protein [Anaerolineae bacterium]|nr:ABC transporter substrate-binding protein [Anaerolineae bacterium]
MKDEERSLPYTHTVALFIVFAVLWLLPDVAAYLEREPDAAWARVQASGVIRFATDASYHPFEGVGSDGVFYGLDIDVAREAARRIGLGAEFVNIGIDGLYDVLRVGLADASISALPLDPARLGRWAYSRSYFEAGLVLITQEDRRLEIGGLPGSRVAVVFGSDGDAWLREQQRRTSGIEAARFDSALAALQAVVEEQVDAAVLDAVTARQMLAQQFGDLHSAAQLTHEPYVIAVWGESVELRAALDRALEAMQADGALERIVEEWMRNEE